MNRRLELPHMSLGEHRLSAHNTSPVQWFSSSPAFSPSWEKTSFFEHYVIRFFIPYLFYSSLSPLSAAFLSLPLFITDFIGQFKNVFFSAAPAIICFIHSESWLQNSLTSSTPTTFSYSSFNQLSCGHTLDPSTTT